jgi:serine/threonine protein kinase
MQMRPSTSAEDTEFLRERVASMGRLGASLALFMFMVAVAIDLVEDGRVAWEKPAKAWHLIGILLMMQVWLINRKFRLSERNVRILEGLGVVGATSAFTIMSCSMAQAQSPHLTALLAATLLAVSRAIYVPCRPMQTFQIGILQGLPLVASVVFSLRNTPIESIQELSQSLGADSSADVAGIIGAVTAGWWIASMSLATAATQVIYGLRRRVKEIRKLGQYTLEEKLGEGGMGEVYRASHSMLRRPTAVKLLAAKRISIDDVQRFESEVQLTASLTHPNTITVFDYGRTPEDVFYYAMEFIDGATLSEVVEVDGAQNVARVIHILHDVLAALVEAHGIGLVHRDIKPANIMLCRQGGKEDFTKVLDFGLVMTIDQEKSGSSDPGVLGTPLYMAPESFFSPGDIDARTDLYAVGAVGYFLLTGNHVFPSETVGEVARRHQEETPQLPSERLGEPVAPDVELFLLRLLAKSREDRPQSAAEALSELRKIAVSDWTDDQANKWWQHFGEIIRRNRRDFKEDVDLGTFNVGFDDSQATLALSQNELGIDSDQSETK